MKTAKLINEILESVERLIKNIRTLFTNIKKLFKKREKCNHIIYDKKYIQLEPYIFKF